MMDLKNMTIEELKELISEANKVHVVERIPPDKCCNERD